ncbi:MAG: polysaccharide deacetylase family protein [Alphaproteobacteria bacterium]|jgi:peptidoglycan/xylan/chitin deacetylase (PgdA/CDA1 family)|nr:polysaccharide deacetylase family protein [Alphaproteobacteria bacterium]MBT7943267.1 polysaccharide deacetylase family protein [Alphaproteobacteria bacterium]
MVQHSTPSPIRTYQDFVAGQSTLARARGLARDTAIRLMAAGRSPENDGIRFPYYHHVFNDEREGFARQLKYMASLGDFIGIDDAVAMLNSGAPITGRYFCLTFDDGFKNWATNAVPLLLDAGATAAFFIVTGCIGTSIEDDRDKLLGFYDQGDLLMEFLNWDDCRAMADAGMTIGSHTVNHVHLAELDDAEVQAEMQGSKETIEAELDRVCDHFCCPFGRATIDYLPDRDPSIARSVGYRSFLATNRGMARQGTSPMEIPRDHLLAGWDNYQLQYFYSRSNGS